jgi:hypothetical protein
MIRRIGRIDSKSTSLYLITFCIAISFWTAAYPFSRAFLKTQITYNEGWNAYNAMKVAEHQPLYPSAYGWTSVNYPALSFHLIAALGSLDYSLWRSSAPMPKAMWAWTIHKCWLSFSLWPAFTSI